jgi:hypothetical protein
VADHPAASFRLNLAAKFIEAMAILKAVEEMILRRAPLCFILGDDKKVQGHERR